MTTDAPKGLSMTVLLIIVITVIVFGAFIVFTVSGNDYVVRMAAVIGNLIILRTP